jgi:hypothetical protein
LTEYPKKQGCIAANRELEMREFAFLLLWRLFINPFYPRRKVWDSTTKKKRSLIGRLYRRYKRVLLQYPAIARGVGPALKDVNVHHDRRKDVFLRRWRRLGLADSEIEDRMRRLEFQYRVRCLGIVLIAPYSAAFAPVAEWIEKIQLSIPFRNNNRFPWE